jgi:acyl-CoA synthetase (AMP-forming)/AMP-acid ligase II
MALLIGEVFSNAAAAVPARVAVVDGERSLTFAELDRAGNQTAHALRGLGLARSDRVVMWADSTLDAVPLFAGLAKAGAVFAPANAGLGVEEAIATIGRSRPRFLVVDPDRAEAGQEVAAALDVPLLRLGGSGPGSDLLDLARQSSTSDATASALTEHETQVIFFTSGSTGASKGVLLSHRVNWLRTRPPALVEPRGATMCVFPLFHMGAWTLALQAWQARSTLVLATTDAASICTAAAEHRVERLNAVPAIWRRLLDEPGAADALATIRFADSGTSATPPDLLSGMAELLPQARRRVFYGSTEAGLVSMLDDSDMEAHPGSCGVADIGVKLRLGDDGEVQVKSAMLFDRYFDDPDATSRALLQGWYHSGDLGTTDPDGYLSIVGRVREVIRTGGESVSPAEVEHVLAEHRDVAEVAVVGLPDPDWGEIVCAVVVPADPAHPPSLTDLQDFARNRLARFKQPRRLELRLQLPRTAATQQVQRRLLVEELGS